MIPISLEVSESLDCLDCVSRDYRFNQLLLSTHLICYSLVFVSLHLCLHTCTCECKKITCWSPLFPPTMWVPGKELRALGLVASALTCWTMLLSLFLNFCRHALMFLPEQSMLPTPQDKHFVIYYNIKETVNAWTFFFFFKGNLMP